MQFPYTLRIDQLEALYQLIQNDHLIYQAATGSGKSLIFQKYIFDHPETRTLLVSPLNALSRQQAERFQNLGIKVFQKNAPNLEDCGVWIISPEKLKDRMLDHLVDWRPKLLIVDEAHCIWEWGNRFRPDFKKTLELVKLPSIQKSFWCSATLPQSSQRLLFDHLSSLEQCSVYSLGKFSLPADLLLRLEKIAPEIRLNWLRNTLGLYADQNGMVFCNTRQAAESIQKRLKHWGIKSFFYHAGLSIEEKLSLETQLKAHNESLTPVVVVATSAFGMGMDYSFFRFCILFEPPYSLLSLVQAIGRIGRNTNAATASRCRAHVLWHPIDFGHKFSIVEQQEVLDWCRSHENPVRYLENYFNGAPNSGTLKQDERPNLDTNRS